MKTLSFFRVVSLLALLGLLGLPAGAQLMDQGKPLGAAAQGSLPSYLKDAGVVQRLGQPLPLALPFTDSTGQQGPLSGFMDHKPTALALVYYRCAMLCPQVLHGLADGLRQTGLTVGKQYSVVVVSIDPGDSSADAANAKQQFMGELGEAGNAPAAAGVHFLTGSQGSIDAMAAATGFHYVKVPGPDGKLDQYAHSSVVMFATGDGVLSEYLSGIDYPVRDVRLALVDASGRKIATPKDLFLLYCCNYVPAAGRYSVAVLRILGFAGMLTCAGMILGVFLLVRKPRGVAASV